MGPAIGRIGAASPMAPNLRQRAEPTTGAARVSPILLTGRARMVVRRGAGVPFGGSSPEPPGRHRLWGKSGCRRVAVSLLEEDDPPLRRRGAAPHAESLIVQQCIIEAPLLDGTELADLLRVGCTACRRVPEPWSSTPRRPFTPSTAREEQVPSPFTGRIVEHSRRVGPPWQGPCDTCGTCRNLDMSTSSSPPSTTTSLAASSSLWKSCGTVSSGRPGAVSGGAWLVGQAGRPPLLTCGNGSHDHTSRNSYVRNVEFGGSSPLTSTTVSARQSGSRRSPTETRAPSIADHRVRARRRSGSRAARRPPGRPRAHRA